MKTLAFALLLLPTAVQAQDASEVRRMFEAGQYQQVIQSADAGTSAEALYTAAQSYQKLGSADEARSTYARLAERSEDDPWHFIGVSGQQLLDDNTDGALAAAQLMAWRKLITSSGWCWRSARTGAPPPTHSIASPRSPPPMPMRITTAD
jgi:predicted Zn-dependent protease